VQHEAEARQRVDLQDSEDRLVLVEVVHELGREEVAGRDLDEAAAVAAEMMAPDHKDQELAREPDEPVEAAGGHLPRGEEWDASMGYAAAALGPHGHAVEAAAVEVVAAPQG